MKQMKLGWFWMSGALVGACALGTAACGLESPVPQVSSVESPLDLTWAYCAGYGEYCAFIGTRNVRYAIDGGYREISATDGVQCSPRSFGLSYRHRRRAWGAQGRGYCEVAVAPSADNDAVLGAAGGPAAPADPPSPVAPPPESNPPVDEPPPPTPPMHSGSLPYVDVSAIPTGAIGVGSPMVSSTSDQPVVGDGVGAFRTVCEFSHMNFDDPIVYPGQPGRSHLHAYFGNTAVDASTTELSLADSGNSTCRGGTINRTGYWVPALLDADGKPLKPLSLDAYYKSGYNGIKPAEIQVFPEGLRMGAGDMHSSSAQEHAYWGCRDNYIGNPGSIPNCGAGDAIKMVVEFPQCWDGLNLDSSDHKSHMAYTSERRCPDSHPVPIPAITMNVYYANPGSNRGLHLASDMYDSALPGGMSAHGDWFNGWDSAIVETFVTRCINPGLDCHSHLLGDGRAMR